MNPFTAFYVAGYSFPLGGLLIVIATLISLRDQQSAVWQTLWRVLFIIGFINVMISSTPIPLLLYWGLGLTMSTLLVLLLAGFNSIPDRVYHGVRASVILLVLLITAWELPAWRIPKVPDCEFCKLYVVGDSISAGIGFEGEKTWTDIFNRDYGIETANLAAGGATVGDALSQAKLIKDKQALVLLEIGGNDILRRSTLENYSQELDKLLGAVCQPGRTVVIFEIPPPPFCGEFIRTQRQLAKKYGVILIPRRVFASFFMGKNNTVDGLHLSNRGHEKMAEILKYLLSPAIKKNSR